MVPVFVVVILAVLLGIAVIAFIISRMDSNYGIRTYKKDKEEWKQRRDLDDEEIAHFRNTLSGLARLLPKQYEILGGAHYYPYGVGWDRRLIEDLVQRKDDKSTDKTHDKIIEKLRTV